MPTVPDPILHKLKCVRCKRWLSCGPVKLLPNGGSVCGRCHILKEGPQDQYRHFAFEALACYFQFPCKNWESQCPALLPFKKVLEHEKKCSYGSCCSHPCATLKSKRYLDVKGAIRVEVIPDVVLEYLRCSNCAGYLSCTPIYVCRDGTSLCHRCSAQIQQGPNSEFIRDAAFEVFVDIMIFPCVFRYLGCTQMFKFGEQMLKHESDCPYGQTYAIEPPASLQVEPLEPDVPRNESVDVQQVPLKERGVIKTHSGHIYATITPNAPLFAPSSASNKHDQGMFLDEFQRYRDNLASKWGVSPTGYPQEHQHFESNNGHPVDRYPDYDRQQNRYSMNGSYSPGDGGSSSMVQRTDSVYEQTMAHPHLITELKIKQHLRKVPQNGHRSNGEAKGRTETNDRYYEREEAPRKMEYSVYSS